MGTNEDTLHSRISQLLGPFLYKQGLERSPDPKSMFCKCAVPSDLGNVLKKSGCFKIILKTSATVRFYTWKFKGAIYALSNQFLTLKWIKITFFLSFFPLWLGINDHLNPNQEICRWLVQDRLGLLTTYGSLQLVWCPGTIQADVIESVWSSCSWHVVSQIASTCLFFCNSLKWEKCQNQHWSWSR